MTPTIELILSLVPAAGIIAAFFLFRKVQPKPTVIEVRQEPELMDVDSEVEEIYVENGWATREENPADAIVYLLNLDKEKRERERDD